RVGRPVRPAADRGVEGLPGGARGAGVRPADRGGVGDAGLAAAVAAQAAVRVLPPVPAPPPPLPGAGRLLPVRAERLEPDPVADRGAGRHPGGVCDGGGRSATTAPPAAGRGAGRPGRVYPAEEGMSTVTARPLSLARVDFADLYARHLCRHSQFGI